jgi:uncharacterized protein YgiM (DUF1202 family)
MVTVVSLKGAVLINLAALVLFEFLGFPAFSACRENSGAFASCAVLGYFSGAIIAAIAFYGFIFISLFDGFSHALSNKNPVVPPQQTTVSPQAFRTGTEIPQPANNPPFRASPNGNQLYAIVNTTNLNLRSCADLACNIIVMMPQGTRVKVVGAGENGWSQIQTNDSNGQIVTGYANAKFLTPN